MCACFKHWGLHFFNPNLPRISQRASSLKPVILIARLKIPSLTNRKFRFPHLIICPNFQDLIGPKTKRKKTDVVGKPQPFQERENFRSATRRETDDEKKNIPMLGRFNTDSC
uniref:Uncharacterized protein n=1 Tax=Cacopsylla melanoneura TaxID=428564 RepID=A0A8D8QLG9_9HEMI